MWRGCEKYFCFRMTKVPFLKTSRWTISFISGWAYRCLGPYHTGCALLWTTFPRRKVSTFIDIWRTANFYSVCVYGWVYDAHLRCSGHWIGERTGERTHWGHVLTCRDIILFWEYYVLLRVYSLEWSQWHPLKSEFLKNRGRYHKMVLGHQKRDLLATSCQNLKT